MLDNFEELKPLSTEEWCLRYILKNHVITLLQKSEILIEAKRENKMGEIRKLKYKVLSHKGHYFLYKNHTRTLQNEDKEEISDHEGKA
jgi:hypothetical protein